jgi:hypothetical protein
LTLALHRVFPWDPRAVDGAPYSPTFVPVQQGSGRFDLADSPVLYLGDAPEHAVAEMLQGFRGRPFLASALRRFGWPLALLRVEVPDDLAALVADLDDPARLVALGLRPSDVVSDDRARTRAIAARLHDDGASGLRWWSKLSGDWHAVVLFVDRVPFDRLTLSDPEPLSPSHPAVVGACRQLGISLR